MRLCSVCKQEIGAGREDVLPETRLCVKHGREIEKFGGEFRLSVFQERTSKKGSLKLNYGGIHVTLIRNQVAMQDLEDFFDLQKIAGE